jgi:hypothetical protein
MPSTVPAVKKGLRTWLRLQAGLTSADNVTIYGASDPPAETADMVVLTGVTGPQAPPVMYPDIREETPTLTGYVVVTRPGAGDDAEDAEDAARDRVYALFAVIEAALEADPSAGGNIPGPGKGLLSQGDLTESYYDWEGGAGRRAEIRWTLTWSSDY